jgi:hypothetical protein
LQLLQLNISREFAVLEANRTKLSNTVKKIRCQYLSAPPIAASVLITFVENLSEDSGMQASRVGYEITRPGHEIPLIATEEITQLPGPLQ